jgi:hypothetical protein
MVSFGGDGAKGGTLKLVSDVGSRLLGWTENLKKVKTELKGITDELKLQVKLSSQVSGKGGTGSGLMQGSLGSFTPPAIQAPNLIGGGGGGGPIQAPNLGGGGGIASTVGKVGLGLAAFTYGAMPNTMDAVSQRIAAQSVASFSGMSANQLVSRVNQVGLASGGITSSTGMTMAAANLYYGGGMLAGSRSFNNILGQVGGISAMTGLSNERAGAAYAGMNGMRSLQLGVNIRGQNGELLAPNQIANNLYQRMYGNYTANGGKVTNAQAALVWNPNSRAHQAVMAMAGGNQDLFQSLATNIQLQAANGGKTVDLNNATSVMDKLGWAKDDMRRAQFQKNASDTKLLQNSSNGLIGGYDTAAKAAGAAADALSRLPQPVLDSIGAIKGFTESLGGMNNAGASLSGLLGGLASGIGNVISTMMMLKGGGGLGKLLGAAGEGGGLGKLGNLAGASRLGGLLRLGGAAGATSSLGAAGYAAGGAAAALGGNYLTDRLRDFGYNHMGITQGSAWDRVGTIAAMAGTGAAAGALIAGPVGAVAGTVVGGVMGWFKSNDPSTAQFDAQGGKGDGLGDGSSSRATDAVTWATAAASGTQRWYHLCDRYVANAYGLSHSGYVSAKIHWSQIPAKYKHPGNTNPPAGALVFWSVGVYGHAALSVGGGNISTTHRNHGTPTTMSLAQANKEMPGYYGWAEPYFGGKVLSKLAGASAANSANKAATTANTGGAVGSSGGGAVGSIGANGNSIFVDNSGIHSSATSAAALLGITGGGAVGGGAVGAVTGRSSGVLGTNVGAPSSDGGVQTTWTGGKGGLALYNWLKSAGFAGERLHEAWAIGMRESGGNPTSYNPNRSTGDRSYGLFQINMIDKLGPERDAKFKRHVKGYTGYNSLFNPEVNVRAMKYMSHSGQDWASWRSPHWGKADEYFSQYDSFLTKNGLKSGTKNQYDVGTERVGYDQLARVHKDEMILDAKSAERVRNAKNGGGNTVTINVNVKSASEAEAVKFARKVKAILEQENMVSAVGRF